MVGSDLSRVDSTFLALCDGGFQSDHEGPRTRVAEVLCDGVVGTVSRHGDRTPIELFRQQFLMAVVTVPIGTGKENPW